MSKRLLTVSVLTACLAVFAFAGPVDDVRAGTDLNFDVNAARITLSGFVNDEDTVDPPGPDPVRLPKAPGTLDTALDLSVLFNTPGLPTVPLTGTDLGGDDVRWNFDQVINVCLPASQTGLPFDLLVKRVTIQFTAHAVNVSPFFDPVTGQTYNVRMEDTGGDAGNFLNLETYAFCIENPAVRINVAVRDLDYTMYGGVPEPASLVALGAGLMGFIGLKRRKK